jgi:hypothetical protein
MRIGVVGAGTMGARYAERIRSGEFGRGLELAGVADLDEARARTAAGDAPAFGSVEALLEARPDALYIATPDGAHRGPAVAAAEAGVPFLLEKPLATTLADAQAIAGAVARAGIVAEVNFSNRWNPPSSRRSRRSSAATSVSSSRSSRGSTTASARPRRASRGRIRPRARGSCSRTPSTSPLAARPPRGERLRLRRARRYSPRAASTRTTASTPSSATRTARTARSSRCGCCPRGCRARSSSPSATWAPRVPRPSTRTSRTSASTSPTPPVPRHAELGAPALRRLRGRRAR